MAWHGAESQVTSRDIDYLKVEMRRSAANLFAGCFDGSSPRRTDALANLPMRLRRIRGRKDAMGSAQPWPGTLA